MYKRNFLRIAVGALLLSWSIYMLRADVSPPRNAVWAEFARSAIVPGVCLAVGQFVIAGQNLGRARGRRLGVWAQRQVEFPQVDLYAVGIALLFCLRSFVPAGFGQWYLAGATVVGVLVVVGVAWVSIRYRASWLGYDGHIVCQECGYIVSDAEISRCPECGRKLSTPAFPAPFGRNICIMLR